MLRLLHAAMLLLLAGCTHRAYPGPARPESEVSSVAFSRDGDVTFENLVIDDRPIPAMADTVELLPGKHPFSLESYVERADRCDTREYLCDYTFSRDRCSGSITTLPGRKYLVTVSTRTGSVSIRTSAKGYFDLFTRDDEPEPGYGSCESISTYDRLGW